MSSPIVQIASVMNAVFPNVIGGYTTNEAGDKVPTNVVLKEDLSNIVEFGKAVTATYALDPTNINSYFKQIVDKVGQQLIISDEYDLDEEFSIRKTNLEAGSITEMVFFSDGEFIDNTSWDEIISGSETAPPTFDEMFGLHPVPAKGLYFNRKTTIASEPYTVTFLQWKSAMLSPDGLRAFFAQIQMRWENKMRQLDRKLRKMLVCAWIAEKRRRSWNGCYNILAEYKKAFPTSTVTAATAKTDGDFLRFMKAFIEIMREELRERSNRYNTEGYVGAVPRSRQKMLLYAPFAEYMAVWLYSDKYHDDYVKLGGYDTVANWQSGGNGTDDAVKMQINIQTPNSGGDDIIFDGVVGCIFDDRAIFTVDDNPRVVAQNNDWSEWTNYQHKKDVSLYCTTALNGVVFYISDYVFADDISYQSEAPSDWATRVTAGEIYTQGSDGSFTAVASGTSYDDETEYFVSATPPTP